MYNETFHVQCIQPLHLLLALLLDLMLYLLFIISLESIHQLLTKSSKVITSCNYQKCKLKTKHFGHKIVPKIVTYENVCFQKLESLKILKRQQKFKNLNIWPEKPWEMKISVGVCKFLSEIFRKPVFSEVVWGY